MFCPKCGRMNDDNDTNCKGCGALLHEETEEKKPQKKGIGIKSVISIAVAAAVAVGAGIYAFTSCSASPDAGMSGSCTIMF